MAAARCVDSGVTMEATSWTHSRIARIVLPAVAGFWMFGSAGLFIFGVFTRRLALILVGIGLFAAYYAAWIGLMLNLSRLEARRHRDRSA
jgi:hypothetical protein